MATTQWGTVTDALVSTMRATTGYRSPYASTSGTMVFDGPEYLLFDEEYTARHLVIGWAGDADSLGSSGEAEQIPVSIGNREREETGRIPCLAVAQTGDTETTTAKAMRDAALVLAAAVEAAIRADPWLGITSLRGLVIQFDGVSSLQQLASPDGMACWAEFAVTYTARI